MFQAFSLSILATTNSTLALLLGYQYLQSTTCSDSVSSAFHLHWNPLTQQSSCYDVQLLPRKWMKPLKNDRSPSFEWAETFVNGFWNGSTKTPPQAVARYSFWVLHMTLIRECTGCHGTRTRFGIPSKCGGRLHHESCKELESCSKHISASFLGGQDLEETSKARSCWKACRDHFRKVGTAYTTDEFWLC